MSLIDQVKALRPDVDAVIENFNETIEEDNDIEAGKVALEVYDALDNMDKGWLPSAEHIAKVAVTSVKNVQLRDFLLGLHLEHDITTVGAYLEVICNSVKKNYAYPSVTVLSTYRYIAGDTETAKDYVKDVLKEYPEYNLAKLLDRIFPVFTPDNMREVANGLHAAVKKNLGLESKENNVN